MESGQSCRQSFIIPRQAAETGHPAETSLDYPATRKQHKAPLRGRQFDHFELDAMLFGGLSGIFAGIALIDESDFDRFAGLGLNSFRQFGDLCAILFIGGRHAQGQQMSERIDRQVDFIAFPAFGAVIACPSATFRSRLQSPAIKDGGGRLVLPTRGDPQDGAQIVDQRFEDASFHPAPGLLIDDVPGRQVVGQPTPLGACPHNPAEAIKNFAQRILALWRGFGHQRQVWGDQRPFRIADVTGISFSFHI
jgi:hypothetical protein